MERLDPVAIALAWQEAANAGDIAGLLALSDPQIAIVGPRGTGHGHQLLRDWLGRAGAQFHSGRLFARGDAVVVAQRGVWRDAATGAVAGERAVASAFRVADGRVARLARHDDLDAALADARLGRDDERAGDGA